jgi:D-sedoheptulose 7-phosphate isomerase
MSVFEAGRLPADLGSGVVDYFDGLKRVIDRLEVGQITAVMDRLLETYQRQGSVYVFGNGGSASTASHFVNDFNKGVGETLQKRFRFYSLNDNVPTVLAVANDISYDEVFSQQLRNYLCPGDLVIAISGSGNSPNVLEAVRYANSVGIETVGLVGYDGGELRRLVDHCIHVPVDDMQKVEDLHLVVNHVMTTLFRRRLSAAQAG